MTLELLCMALIAIVFGLTVAFYGYRIFLILLPIWGFFFGFGLGAQTITVLFGDAFLATVTGWVVGFVVGVIFAVLSYLFYIVGVAIFSGSFGYALGIAIMGAIGLTGILAWVGDADAPTQCSLVHTVQQCPDGARTPLCRWPDSPPARDEDRRAWREATRALGLGRLFRA